MPINSFSNKGMFLETLINQTAWVYQNQSTALIYKRHLPISIQAVNEHGEVKGKLLAKSTTDYYGVYQGHMLDFEAKQTSFDYFLNSYLKDHQYEHLCQILAHQGISFIVIHFLASDQYFAVGIDIYQQVCRTSKIKLEWFTQHAFELHLIFPGILDLVNYFNWYIENNL